MHRIVNVYRYLYSMASFSVAWLVIFTTSFFLNVSGDNIPVVFGIPRGNVLLQSNYKVVLSDFMHGSWYRMMPDGRVELMAYFSIYTTKYGRYRGQIHTGTTEVSLTISNVTFSDSGQYFSAVHDIEKIFLGSITVSTVTDPRRDPNLQLFVSHKTDDMADILCEMRDVGLDWDGPRLEVENNTDTSLMDSKTGEAVDSHGVYVRSAMMSYSLGKQTVRVACVSQHKDRLTIRRHVILQRDEMICPWLLYLSLLCGVLFVVTIATGIVWFYKTK
ncbi:uncharacterized protein LOC125748927 [Brienomyrus brachyistius]|uniref:uncharacterized protein LOC125748927 n=1 Tax=Brienomyrus brachyistius TaxID=42636 RepID=UPI0020B37A37|nr:uncharacterized protein LOC125748927 [Brienomyrus brachyistius]